MLEDEDERPRRLGATATATAPPASGRTATTTGVPTCCATATATAWPTSSRTPTATGPPTSSRTTTATGCPTCWKDATLPTTVADADGDGVPDLWEDGDGDGVVDIAQDTDRDGVPDLLQGQDELPPDDGLSDADPRRLLDRRQHPAAHAARSDGVDPMTDSYDTVVSDVRASVSTLRSWADAVIGNWNSYTALHRDHDGFEDCRDGWVEVRDGIRELCTTVASRVDDSSWMADLEDREAIWSRATTRVDDATDAVADARLRATQSWTQGASDRYREVIPGQRIALARAHSGLTWMANGCTGAVEAGLRQLTSVRDALEAVELPGVLRRGRRVRPGERVRRLHLRTPHPDRPRQPRPRAARDRPDGGRHGVVDDAHRGPGRVQGRRSGRPALRAADARPHRRVVREHAVADGGGRLTDVPADRCAG